MKSYYVESNQGWFVVDCRNKREAVAEGTYEYGRRNLKTARLATDAEIKSFKSIKGNDATQSSLLG